MLTQDQALLHYKILQGLFNSFLTARIMLKVKRKKKLICDEKGQYLLGGFPIDDGKLIPAEVLQERHNRRDDGVCRREGTDKRWIFLFV